MRLSTFAVGSGLLALVQVVAAFSDTAPLLAYSSAEASFDRLRVAKRDARGPSALYSRDVARALIKDNQGHVCDLDGIALIEVEDLHHNSFAELHGSNPVKASFQGAQQTFGLQHVSEHTGSAADEIKRAVHEACLGNEDWVATSGSKKRKEGKRTFLKHKTSFRKLKDGTLSETLKKFEASHPSHLIMFTTPRDISSFSRRTAKERKAASQGILHDYRLLSNELILIIIVIVGLLLPIVVIATSLISQISTPDKIGEKSKLTEMSKKAT